MEAVSSLALGLLLFALLLAPGCAEAQGPFRTSTCTEIPTPTPAPPDAMPAPGPNNEWRLHNDALAQRLQTNTRQDPDIVFLGDSITEVWEPGLFTHFFGGYSTLNLGVSGDVTQSMLMRLGQGQWSNLRPRVIVLLIGTNNLTLNSPPPDVAVGVAEILRFLRQKSPQSKIILVGLLPRGQFAAEEQRAVVDQVNVRIKRCADNSSIFYLDAWPTLLDHQGTMSFQISPDTLHMSAVGYALLGTVLNPQLRRLLGPGR